MRPRWLSVGSHHALVTCVTYPAHRMYLPFGASFKRSRIFRDTLAFFFPYRSISDGNIPTSEAIIAMSFGSCAMAMSMSLENEVTLVCLHQMLWYWMVGWSREYTMRIFTNNVTLQIYSLCDNYRCFPTSAYVHNPSTACNNQRTASIIHSL